jgi:hypothetical protein
MHKIPQEAIPLSGDHLQHLQNWFSLDNEFTHQRHKQGQVNTGGHIPTVVLRQ